jgi:hypothetical protein
VGDQKIRAALDGRRLIWFGIRGEDGEALAALPEFAGCLSITAPLKTFPDIDVCLEAISGTRPDLDCYDIDGDPSDAAREFCRFALHAVSERCVVMTYRPAAIISALAFSMADTMTLASPLHSRQAAFEHKPWVESALAARGVRGLGWRYVPDQRRASVERMLDAGPQVLRASHTSGGAGVAIARSAEDVKLSWPSQKDAFVAVAPFLDGVPLNFSGCIFADGSVRLHPPSVQLIGIQSCTHRPFGYCGNDFGAPRDLLDDRTLDRIDALGRVIAAWLYEERYRGVFGVDAIAAEGEVIFTEVNARFQGSSLPSSRLARELDATDLHLDHLTAMLGLAPAGKDLSIKEWARHQPAVSHIVIHNTSGVTLAPVAGAQLPPLPLAASVSQLAEVSVAAGGTLCSLTLPHSVTTSGFHLQPSAEHLIGELRRLFAEQ